jgi:hypothetical protein
LLEDMRNAGFRYGTSKMRPNKVPALHLLYGNEHVKGYYARECGWQGSHRVILFLRCMYIYVALQNVCYQEVCVSNSMEY